jgi:hypothetical protein
MAPRITIAQLEQMKTHDLADLLGNVVLLLRRLPNVEFKELVRPIPSDESGQFELPQPSSRQSFTETALKKMKKDQLQKIASDLDIHYTQKTTNNELLQKILARSAGSHSEQYAIQNI